MRTILATAVLTALAAVSGAQAADIIPVIFDAPGTGYYDPTPVAPVGGNIGTTRGEQRRIVAQYAATLWGSVLKSDVPIYIGAQFTPLAANVLGSAGATSISRDFANAPVAGTWFHTALADSLVGYDLRPGFTDINSNFSTNFTFYYGLDGNTPVGLVNFLDVVMHEYAHGLGFSNFENEATGAFQSNYPDIFSVFTFDNTTGKFWTQMTVPERVASAVNNGYVSFTGPRATAGAQMLLDLGRIAFTATAPAPVAGNYPYGTAAFGPAPDSTNFGSAMVVLATDAVEPPNPVTPGTSNDGCSPFTNAAAIAGKIALIDRGYCGFAVKAKNAQNAGAKAVIIANNAAGAAPGMSGVDPTVTIPTVSVSQANGNLFKLNLPVTIGFVIDPTKLQGADDSGRPLLYMPNPVESGSSGSHYDKTATPNLLMEPAINGSLRSYYNLDITPALMADIGWKLNTGNSKIGSPNMLDCDAGVPVVSDSGLMAGATVTASHEMCLVGAQTRSQYKTCMDENTDRLVDSGLLTYQQGQKVMTCVYRVVQRTRFPIPQ